jgi:Domain of unknown function (DUF6249)
MKHPMSRPVSRPATRPFARRIVLGGAIVGALVVAFGPYAPVVRAGESESASKITTTVIVAQADVAKPPAGAAKSAAAKESAQAAKEAAQAAKEAAQIAKDDAQAARDEAANGEPPTITIDHNGIRVEDGASSRKKRVHIGLGGTDREYDSFDQFMHEDRGLAFMVVMVVFLVFLTPVLIVGLLIWYKLRKNRMLNETMIQLAEKGVAPTTEMMQALQSGRPSAAVAAISTRAGAIEQVKTLRSQAAWSDLRKGVVLAAVGLALTAFSMFDDRSPNSVGLVLLFLGIGYGLLWHFEDRQLAAPTSAPPPPPAGGL